jgi:putative hydrolase
MKKNFLKRFKSVTGDDLLSDMHLHTTWTDGEASVGDMIAEAVRKGLKRIAFTDHVREASTYCKEFEKEIKELSNKSGIHVHPGFEAKIKDFDGNLDLPDYCSRERHLIIGSVHSIPVAGGEFVHPKIFKSSEELRKNEYELYMALIKSGQADILGHVGGMSNTFTGSFSREFLEGIISLCAKTQTAFEINSRYHSNMMDELVPLLEKYDPYVSIGSDAHNPGEVGSCQELLKKHYRKR